MPGWQSARLVQTALRCYPERWRSRHGGEAAELSSLLMRDGKTARPMAWSDVKGAASTGTANRGPIPGGHYHVAGGVARSSDSISVRVTAKKPADSNAASRHGRHC